MNEPTPYEEYLEKIRKFRETEQYKANIEELKMAPASRYFLISEFSIRSINVEHVKVNHIRINKCEIKNLRLKPQKWMFDRARDFRAARRQYRRWKNGR